MPSAPTHPVSAHPVPAHPVKTERHDTSRCEHHTNTGVRAVETYREHERGLYVARPFYNHPRVAFWEAHLLPELGVQLCRYELHGGRREFDYYIDVADVTREGSLWTVRDLYLDLVVWTGAGAEILDTPELLAARAAGLIAPGEAWRAVERAHEVLNGLARARYDVDRWLAGWGAQLTWHDRVLA